MGDIAGKHTVDAHLDAGMQDSKFGQGGKESVDGAFVHTQREFAALQALQFGESLFDFITKVNQALGVVFQKRARIGEANRPGATNEKRLAKGVLEFADGQANGGLGAVKALASAGEATLLCDHEKYLKFTEVQGILLAVSIRRNY